MAGRPSRPEAVAAVAAGAATRDAVSAEATAVAARSAFFMPMRLGPRGKPHVNEAWPKTTGSTDSGKTCHLIIT
ncbi:hypothetical protein GCM10010336_53960 [Streptomyces goshikiensis]|nr:hypothetical protein GCM10010336_53960 [Streptomyces goshikiensis]